MSQLTSGLNTAAGQLQQLHAAGQQFGQAAAPIAGQASNAYQLAKQFTQGSGILGGGYTGGFFGGNEEEARNSEAAKELREYGATLAAKTKEEVIRKLARAMKRAGIPVDPDGDIDSIVKTLVEKIPNPRKGKTFAADAKSQEKVCKTIAEVLNDEFSPGAHKVADKFIDTSLGPANVCRQVAEWVHSFTSGVSAEFMEVHASVKRVLRNIEVLDRVMEELYNNIARRIPNATKAGVEEEIGNFDDVYRRARKERQRQEELLKNFLHVTLAPAQKELELAMRDETEAHRLIENIGLKPGTAGFADSLAMAISGLGTVAAVAQKVHKALKDVGLSISQYLDSADMQALNKLLDEKMMSGAVKSDDIGKFLEAVQTLRRNFDRRTELKSGFDDIAGGADDDDDKSNVVKRVEKRKAERQLLLKDFVGKLKLVYQEIVVAMKGLVPLLGKEIPITDKTDALRDSLARLQDQTKSGRLAQIEIALIGLAVNVESREQKDRYLSAIKLVISTIDSLLALEGYRGASPQLSRLKAALENLEKQINFFSDIVTKKYGGQGNDGAEYSGGAGLDDYMTDISTVALNITEALGEFTYFYYIAKVRANLAQTAQEISTYGEKYTDVLGDAVAARVNALEENRRAITTYLNIANGQPGAHPLAANAAAMAGIKEFVQREYDTKAKFYRALQAIDLYMKAFTDAIVKEPDAVRDIKRILDGTQVIARWFSEETGENLWKAFENMPAYNANGVVAAPGRSVLNPAAGINADDHYYIKVRGAALAAGAPHADVAAVGLPQAGVDPGSNPAKEAKKAIDAMFEVFQGLKNLTNAFSRIGDRFGGREIRTQIFMSPTQIYKTLMDYMKASAFSMHKDEKTGAPLGTALQLPLAPAGVGAALQPVVAAGSPQIYFSSTFKIDTGAGPADFRGNWFLEDQYFQLILKSMSAKVLTVLGMYDMLERKTPLQDLTPTRMIVGGAADEPDPEAIEDAAELYFRLPRLAEFYRGFLRWDGRGFSEKIAMLPELEGVFSGLIRLVFQKMMAPETGDYSDTELKAMIREVNTIFMQFQANGKERAVSEALNAFVREINRRYGVIKQDDMTKYWDMVNESRSFTATGSLNPTNYAILPGEDEYETDRRAPSDRYALGAPGAEVKFKSKYSIDQTDWTDPAARRDLRGQYNLLRGFRGELENALRVDPATYGRSSYGFLIRQAALEIKRASTKEAKLAVATKLIQGTSVAALDSNKAFMFHETIVVGLNILSVVQRLLTRFSMFVESIDFERACEEMRNGILANLLAAVPGNAAATRASIIGYIGNNYVDGSVGRQAAVQAYVLAAATNIMLRGDADDLTTANAFFALLREEINDANAAGLNAAPAYEAELIPDNIRAALSPAGRAAATAALRFEAAMNVAFRMIFDYNRAMRDLIENLYDLIGGGNGLIGLRFPGTPTLQLQLDFSKLSDFCMSLMGSVKAFLDQLRPFVSADVIRRFEDRTTPGSVFWLEENLLDRFFRGTGTSTQEQATMADALSRRLNRVFLYLIRDTYSNGAFMNDLVVTIGAGPANTTRANSSHSAIREGVNSYLDAVIAGGGARVFTAAALVGAAAGRLTAITPPAANNWRRFETYGRALSEIIWYDAGAPAADAPINVLAVRAGAANDDFPLQNLIASEVAPPPGRALTHAQIGGADAGRYQVFNGAKGLLGSRSLMFAFNQLLAKYLSRLTDVAGGVKIYTSLINAFANGIASQSVSSPATSAHPDLLNPANTGVAGAGQVGITFGWRGDPKPGALIFQSLAFVLQRLAKDANPTNQTPDHLYSTLADVPMYMKEGYRANLPNFIKLFDAISQKCDFIKQFIQKATSSSLRLRLNRPSTNGLMIIASGVAVAARIPNNTLIAAIVPVANMLNAAAAGAAGPAAVNPDRYLGAASALDIVDTGLTDEAMRAKITSICDGLSSFAYTLSSAASEVRKELADQPIYLQTQEGSIESYKARYGKLPLMPLSLSLYFLGDLAPLGAVVGSTNDTRLMPDHALGEPAFKIAYGVRGLLSGTGPISYDQMPGVKTIVDGFNGVASGRDQIDPTQFLEFARRIVSGLRFVVDVRNFRPMISVLSAAAGLFSVPPLTGAGTGVTLAPANTRTAAYPIDKTVQSVLDVVESSNQDDQAEKVVAIVGGPAGAAVATNRQQERIFNLIDMNIVPINVHALMRDIPLVNIFNYSYTFEQMVCMLYGKLPSDIDASTEGDAKTTDTRTMFLRLMMDPYMPVTKPMYGSDLMLTGTGGYVHRIFRGDNNLGMGRPKFLSDQVFNKALFGSVYPTAGDFDEAGPPAGSAIARGRDLNEAQQAVLTAQAVASEVARLFAILNPMRLANTAGQAMRNGANAGGGGFAAAPAGASERAEVAEAWIAGNGAAAAAAPAMLARLQNWLAAAVVAANAVNGAAYANVAAVNAAAVAGEMAASGNAFVGAANAEVPALPGGPFAITAVGASNAIAALLIRYRTQEAQVYIDNAPTIRSWNGRLQDVRHRLGAWAPAASIALVDAAIAAPAGAVAAIAAANVVLLLGGGPPALQIATAGGFGAASNLFIRELNPATANAIGVTAAALVAGPNNLVTTITPALARRAGQGAVANPASDFMRGVPNAPVPGDFQARNNTLTYLTKPAAGADEDTAVVAVPIGANAKAHLENIATYRWNTRVVRNLFFITNLVRLIRLKLNRELTQSRHVIVSSHDAVSANLMEYGTGAFGPNETIRDRPWDDGLFPYPNP